MLSFIFISVLSLVSVVLIAQTIKEHGLNFKQDFLLILLTVALYAAVIFISHELLQFFVLNAGIESANIQSCLPTKIHNFYGSEEVYSSIYNRIAGK